MCESTNELLLLEFPEQFETERLIIRAPQWGDGAAVNEAIRESINELRQWMPWALTTPTVEETEANIRRARLQFLERTDMRLHLYDKESGELLGCSGLHRINWKIRSFEIGYWLRTSQTGRGWMTEAVHGITRFASRQLQANRIEIRCDSRNERSRRVAERCGFTLEGILRREDAAVHSPAEEVPSDRQTSGVSDSVPQQAHVACPQLRDTMVFSKIRGIEFS